MRRRHDVERDPVGRRAEVRVQTRRAGVGRALPGRALADGRAASGCPCSRRCSPGRPSTRCPARRPRRQASAAADREPSARRRRPTVARIRFTPRVSAAAAVSLRRSRRRRISPSRRGRSLRPPSSSPPRSAASTNSDSGILSTTSPFTTRNPWPLPAAMPRSASRASPGPFTTHPMTATRIGAFRPLALERLVHLLREPEHVDLGAAARRARDEIQAPLPQPERLQDRRADLDLLDGVVRERDADRVADPLGEQRPDPDRALHPAHRHRARLGDAEVQRVVALLRELPVGLDHDRAGSSASREILMSKKSSSSRMRASFSADSTSASGVGAP